MVPGTNWQSRKFITKSDLDRTTQAFSGKGRNMNESNFSNPTFSEEMRSPKYSPKAHNKLDFFNPSKT